MPILACICKRRANNLQSERDHTRSFKAYDPDLPFQAPEGKKLEISSSLFGIHPSKDCKYDYLAITGVRNKKIVKCGKREFKHVTKSNRALFQFKSSKKVNARITSWTEHAKINMFISMYTYNFMGRQADYYDLIVNNMTWTDNI